ATVTATQTAALSLAKSATPTSYTKDGAVISYSRSEERRVGEARRGPCTVSDDKKKTSCPATPASLAPGAAITCTASYTTTQADVDAGAIINKATGHASFKSTAVISTEATATVTATQTAALSLAKSATPTSYTKDGAVISYS